MSWFPYPGGDLKLDKFYAILYDDSEMEWRWCYNRITEPFYDRSWQVEVVGPISSSIGNGEWASLVISNLASESKRRWSDLCRWLELLSNTIPRPFFSTTRYRGRLGFHQRLIGFLLGC